MASCFLAIPFTLLEARGATHFVKNASGLWHFLLNGTNAFALNLSVFLLLGRTSALTMNICGLMKDWFTIAGERGEEEGGGMPRGLWICGCTLTAQLTHHGPPLLPARLNLRLPSPKGCLNPKP